MDNSLLARLRACGNDTEGALARFSGKTALYERLLREFAREETFSELAEAMEKGDVAAAHSSAHTLKGIAGNLGLIALYQSALSLDALLRTGELAGAEPLYLALCEQYEAVMELL